MSEEESNKNKPFSPELPEGFDDNNNLSVSSAPEFVDLSEGTLESDETTVLEEKEQISDEDLLKLLQFTTGIKTATPEELEELRNDEKELERLIRVSIVKSRNYTYKPKKHFGVAYKKKRQKKNRMAKLSRRANR